MINKTQRTLMEPSSVGQEGALARIDRLLVEVADNMQQGGFGRIDRIDLSFPDKSANSMRLNWTRD